MPCGLCSSPQPPEAEPLWPSDEAVLPPLGLCVLYSRWQLVERLLSAGALLNFPFYGDKYPPCGDEDGVEMLQADWLKDPQCVWMHNSVLVRQRQQLVSPHARAALLHQKRTDRTPERSAEWRKEAPADKLERAWRTCSATQGGC